MKTICLDALFSKYPDYIAGKIIYYGTPGWPSYSYWIVPGTITDEERI